ncbi:MAG: hypothetical protein IKM73_00775 [Acidaminococcaceae bacterium]|jgi:hypothetical protein|nr:hypothetical protein [Acidaminococcaceae bacterium]MBR6859840.1 hypothetical protein [Acidaminococcaceae bacterium]
MQIVTGTRREITIRQWEEQLEKYVKRLNDSMECFRRFHGDSDAEHIMEDAEKLVEIARHTKDAIYALDFMGIN